MTEFAPAQKILAVCLHRWIHYGFAFYLANGKTMLIWITRNSKDPVVSWREQWIPTLSHEARQECDHKLRLLPYSVLIGFFCLFVCILFQCNDYLNMFFPPPKRARTRKNGICWLCVCSVREHKLDDAFGWGCREKPVVFQPVSLHSVHTARAR